MRQFLLLFAVLLLGAPLTAQTTKFLAFDLGATYSQLHAPAERVEGGFGINLGINYGYQLPVTSFVDLRAGIGLGLIQARQSRIHPGAATNSERLDIKLLNNQYSLTAPLALVWKLGTKSPLYARTGIRYQFSVINDVFGWDPEVAEANGHGSDCPGDGRVPLSIEGEAVMARHQFHGELGLGFDAASICPHEDMQPFFEVRLTRTFEDYATDITSASDAAKNQPTTGDNFQSARLWTLTFTTGYRF
ncbi:MAG: hypothetical protein AAFZ52_00785 [Bacteroidota bacterium]